MNKIVLSTFIILCTAFTVRSQTEEQKKQAFKPIEKTLLDQMKLATLLKDAGTGKMAIKIFIIKKNHFS